MIMSSWKSKSPTRMARRAIAEFVESNIPRFNGWLQQVANGIPQYGGDGEVVKDLKGSTVWLVKPDPAQALKLVGDIAEYHLPKLSRSDVALVAQVEHLQTVEQMSSDQLRARLLVSLGVMAEVVEGDVVEQQVEAAPVVEIPAD